MTLKQYKAMDVKCYAVLIKAKVLCQRRLIRSRLLIENNLRRFLEAVRT